ncbi:NUDIX hydrolase [Criblamydia sequanensis]|uniref:GDP-mannose pyrophosphatase n=1 Tax=Candidatus Criblamydia sequanensis CRIB-18 TaxID=1437425 RepID=A0A090CYE9_9BACT|nr:NUDIX hydrolase [Criblamydia sequanensis]CDR33376.1 Nudix hydrolase [Criblamydia sequanensis CRIB-18]
MINDPIKDSQCVFQGVKFDVYQTQKKSREGNILKKEFIAHNGAVVILPFLNQNEILLIQNHRFAVNETLFELPAGTLEMGEEPMNAAFRELAEETGYEAKVIEPLNQFFTSPGISNEKMFAFVATDLKETLQNLDEGEEIEVTKMSFSTALDLIKNGRIKDGKTISTLLYYKAFKK